MRKSVQKNHNKANSKEIHAPHPTNKKSTDFIPKNRIKSAPYFQIHFTDPSQTHYRPIGPIGPIRHKKHQRDLTSGVQNREICEICVSQSKSRVSGYVIYRLR